MSGYVPAIRFGPAITGYKGGREMPLGGDECWDRVDVSLSGA